MDYDDEDETYQEEQRPSRGVNAAVGALPAFDAEEEEEDERIFKQAAARSLSSGLAPMAHQQAVPGPSESSAAKTIPKKRARSITTVQPIRAPPSAEQEYLSSVNERIKAARENELKNRKWKMFSQRDVIIAGLSALFAPLSLYFLIVRLPAMLKFA